MGKFLLSILFVSPFLFRLIFWKVITRRWSGDKQGDSNSICGIFLMETKSSTSLGNEIIGHEQTPYSLGITDTRGQSDTSWRCLPKSEWTQQPHPGFKRHSDRQIRCSGLHNCRAFGVSPESSSLPQGLNGRASRCFGGRRCYLLPGAHSHCGCPVLGPQR